MIDRKLLKQQAKDAMHEARPAPMLVTLVLVLLTGVLAVLTMSLNGTLAAYRDIYAAAMAGQTPSIPETSWTGGGIGWLLGVALEVMSIELSVGFVIYALRVSRREKAGVGSLFDSFGVFFRSIWITILPSIFVGLWSLVYVIPVSVLIVMTGHYWWLLVGLPLLLPMYIASYSYSLSTYIMLDNPSMNCFACIAMSRMAMKGYKWKRFVLDLSFIGWILLCCIPLVGVVLMLWLRPYMDVTAAGFYEKVIQDFMRRNAPSVGPSYPEA